MAASHGTGYTGAGAACVLGGAFVTVAALTRLSNQSVEGSPWFWLGIVAIAIGCVVLILVGGHHLLGWTRGGAPRRRHTKPKAQGSKKVPSDAALKETVAPPSRSEWSASHPHPTSPRAKINKSINDYLGTTLKPVQESLAERLTDMWSQPPAGHPDANKMRDPDQSGSDSSEVVGRLITEGDHLRLALIEDDKGGAGGSDEPLRDWLRTSESTIEALFGVSARGEMRLYRMAETEAFRVPEGILPAHEDVYIAACRRIEWLRGQLLRIDPRVIE